MAEVGQTGYPGEEHTITPEASEATQREELKEWAEGMKHELFRIFKNSLENDPKLKLMYQEISMAGGKDDSGEFQKYLETQVDSIENLMSQVDRMIEMFYTNQPTEAIQAVQKQINQELRQ